MVATWPSDSESLLVEFKQGLTQGLTGDSEILQLDWLSGSSLLKPAKCCVDVKDEDIGGIGVEDFGAGEGEMDATCVLCALCCESFLSLSRVSFLTSAFQHYAAWSRP